MPRFALLVAALFAFAVACETQVKQQQPPRIPDNPNEHAPEAHEGEGEGDISAEEEDDAAVPVEKKEVTPEERRKRCCEQCVNGLKADKTGDAPDKIACSDFTVYVKTSCQKWFHDNPMMASEAESCLAESSPETPPPG